MLITLNTVEQIPKLLQTEFKQRPTVIVETSNSLGWALKPELWHEVTLCVSNLVLDIPKVPTYNSANILSKVSANDRHSILLLQGVHWYK